MIGKWDSWLADRARVRQARGVQRHDPVRRMGLDLASNDYLGMAHNPQVTAAAVEAVRRHGCGAGASRVVTGTSELHHELEQALCELTGRSAALSFATGYAANLGVLNALAGPGTLLVLDAHAHASLHDGARLAAHSTPTLFAHNDPAELERILATRRQLRALVAIESIYSVLGDRAPLTELAAICASHDALLIVDEAHALGVSHPGGEVRAAGLHQAAHVLVTTSLSKAFGAQGGAVLFGGPNARSFREQLVNAARSFIFDSALAPAAAAAARTVATMLYTDPSPVAHLAQRNRQILEAFGDLGCFEPGAGAIHSLRMPDAETAAHAMHVLDEAGIAVGCFRPPSVPDGFSRLRLTARADLAHTELAQALVLIRDTLTRQGTFA
ncbi:aminotransferase class I/II-fold pyridoxal phosphate-dependent enzyme [Glutamicibacter sp. PS]|uniref:aminotransferase class I/II-fold pyridoxal phosphate-dependent enzyme n=1 Tax=Glutamicibacter sp. PS TaxID=3075634 RepID=UPI00283AFA7D|nr:aminotransferase class I/II-fold pyridoxal phosphate-dependent enzyme [Glutamicibacter sp. PS]MDR4534014.1 aminotransferase class I/II-fold pyridoxal phosphate-dependent enzyme [Glutamicibacter sp. PS]